MTAPILEHTEAVKKQTPAASARRVAVRYCLLGCLWIIASDLFLNYIAHTRLADDIGDVVKGLLFVIVTALVLWQLLRRELLRRERISEESLLFQHLTESSHDAIFMVDPSDRFRIVYVNEAAVKHFGHSRAQLQTMRVFEWSPSSTLALAEEMWARIRKEGFINFESVHRLADGRDVPVEITANKIVFCGKEYLAGSWRNISERKRAEAALRETSERYELALRGAGLGTWDWNIPTGKMILNARWAEMLGYRLEELAPDLETWQKLVHPEDMPRVNHALNEHLEGRSGFFVAKYRLKTKSGEWLWVLDSGCVFERDAAGNPVRAVGTHQDIDVPKRAKQALLEQTTMLEGILNSVPQAVFWKDKEGRYLGCNQVFARSAGRNSSEEIVGMTDFELPWGATEAARYVADDREVVQSRQVKAGIIEPITLKDGTLRWLETSKTPLIGHDGAVFGVLGVFEDITERKVSQEALRRNEELFSGVYNSSMDALFLVDWETRLITDCNARAMTMFEADSKAEIIGQPGHNWHRTPRTPERARLSYETVAEGKEWMEEIEYKTLKGRFFWGLFAARKLELPKSGTVLVRITDITQRKQMEAQYLRAQRMEAIGLLAGGIAHDLNNVLAPILMSIQLLEEMHPDEETRGILRNLHDSAQRGADIVRQVLTFARGIRGELLLLSPKHLIKDVGRVAHEAFPRNIRVSADAATNLWNVTGDPTQLHQVLLNLCINARDAMPDGGTLRIAGRNENIGLLTGALGTQTSPGDYVVLSVADTGTGIPADLHERIFEPFFTTKEQGKGTGLGLSTVMGIVKSHHGCLRLLSEPGKGSEFLVYLPAVKQNVLPPESNETATVPSGNGELVLVVDDEPAIQEVAKDILTRRGYQVLTASDGTEAISLIAQHDGQVQLVVTDIMMPFMDGVALVRSLRRMAPEVKVIACSGLASGASMSNKVEELRRLGVFPIMHKPFVAQRLLRNVHLVLNGGRPEVEETSPAENQ